MRNRKILFRSKLKSEGDLGNRSMLFNAANNQNFPFPYGLLLKFVSLTKKILEGRPTNSMRIFRPNLSNLRLATQFYKSFLKML